MFLLWFRQLPWCGDWTPASVPPSAKGRSNPTNTSVFPPTFFVLPSFAWVCMFSSAGQVLLSALSSVLHALLCLKLCSWCIQGERCTPRPTSPLPSCSPLEHILMSVSNFLFSAPLIYVFIPLPILFCLDYCISFLGLPNKVWQTRWLKIEIYFLTVLEA